MKLSHKPLIDGYISLILNTKICKQNIFVDEYERPDLVEDCKQFLNTMKKLEPYLIELEENNTMEAKNYPLDCKVKVDERRLIIVIKDDECTFSSNDDICKSWTQIGDTFLRPKDCRQKIIASKFLLLFGHLNFSSLPKDKKKKLMEKAEITIIKAVVLFGYKKPTKGIETDLNFTNKFLIKRSPLQKPFIQVIPFYFSLTMSQVIQLMQKMDYALSKGIKE